MWKNQKTTTLTAASTKIAGHAPAAPLNVAQCCVPHDATNTAIKVAAMSYTINAYGSKALNFPFCFALLDSVFKIGSTLPY